MNNSSFFFLVCRKCNDLIGAHLAPRTFFSRSSHFLFFLIIAFCDNVNVAISNLRVYDLDAKNCKSTTFKSGQGSPVDEAFL